MADREASPQQRVAVRLQLGIDVLGRTIVVRPGMNSSDTTVGQLRQAKHHSVIKIVRTVVLSSRPLCLTILEPAIGKEVSAVRAPHVKGRIDETWHDDYP